MVYLILKQNQCVWYADVGTEQPDTAGQTSTQDWFTQLQNMPDSTSCALPSNSVVSPGVTQDLMSGHPVVPTNDPTYGDDARASGDHHEEAACAQSFPATEHSPSSSTRPESRGWRPEMDATSIGGETAGSPEQGRPGSASFLGGMDVPSPSDNASLWGDTLNGTPIKLDDPVFAHSSFFDTF